MPVALFTFRDLKTVSVLAFCLAMLPAICKLRPGHPPKLNLRTKPPRLRTRRSCPDNAERSSRGKACAWSPGSFVAAPRRRRCLSKCPLAPHARNCCDPYRISKMPRESQVPPWGSGAKFFTGNTETRPSRTRMRVSNAIKHFPGEGQLYLA
jgi:hypothetical protein